MNPIDITQWIQIAQILITLGVDLGGKLKPVIHAVHPELTDDQLHAAYQAIMSDDAVRASIAARNAGDAPPTPPVPPTAATQTGSNT